MNIKIIVLFFAILFIRLLASDSDLIINEGQTIRLTARLISEPQVLGEKQSFKINNFEIVSFKYPEFHFGDELLIVGKVKRKSWSFGWIKKETYLLNYPKIEKIESTGGLSIKAKGFILEIGKRLKDVYIRNFPRPLDGIIAGVVLGDKNLISKDFWEKLKTTGTLHIMVASGMNIAMISEGILSFLSYFLSRRKAILILIVLIWLYTIMTGSTPSIVRAAIMASLIYFAQVIGRETGAGRTLFLTAAVMIIFSPNLLFDLGFELSFMSTAGLVFLSPKLKKIKFFLFRFENFTSSIASLIATLPLLFIFFGRLNFLSPFINLIILWTIPYILQLGIAVGVLGLLWTTLGEMASFLLFPFVYYVKQIIDFFAKFSLFQIELPKMGWWFALLYYGLLAILIKNNRKEAEEE